MLVRVLIKRHFKEGKSREIFALLNRFRSDAIKEVGYVSGETLFDFDDPLKFLVISTWNGVENWINWKERPMGACWKNIWRNRPNTKLIFWVPIHTKSNIIK